MAAELARAWLLHRRPYKERAVIAEFLVEGHGRLAMVVQGVRSLSSGKIALLQPFTEVLLSWRGRSDLKTLSSIEVRTWAKLSGNALFCGFYLNELVIRAVMPRQQLDGLMELYTLVLNQLATPVASVEPLLRFFELQLLQLTGYLPTLTHEAITGKALRQGGYYYYQPHVGLVEAGSAVLSRNGVCQGFSTEVLLSLARRDFSQPGLYPDFKRFSRVALEPLLGGRPLKSRELFTRQWRSANRK
ncbi:DNA repair protein RecO [Candidatus Sororendozoicomonas aggregata]|uniref:DNA repair protein RecO n=1 Tax=Candidatus Sororendozoicomonas aggregata TaxID=3073239 RepID=UPI002ED521A5